MRHLLPVVVALLGTVALGSLEAAVHRIDPARGQTLAATLGTLRPGDVAVLATGYHGEIEIRRRHCDPPITVTAAPGETPSIGWLTVTSSSGWTFQGLTISPSLSADRDRRGPIVNLGHRRGRDSTGLVIADCLVYSVLDASAWTAEDWNTQPCDGITLDHGGKGNVARNNHVLNTRYGIVVANANLAEGNIVENFCGDGMRVTYHGAVARHNVIKNCYNVSDHHDDGIQCYLHHRGTGTVEDVEIVGNMIIEREWDDQPHPGPLQGVGFFDGPLVDFLVAGNVVDVSSHHGITLFDAQGCTIRDNTVYDSRKGHAWIQLGDKQGKQRNNTVIRNRSNTYKIDSPGLTKADNRSCSEQEYLQAKKALMTTICREYGLRHPISGKLRLTENGHGLVPQGYAPYRGPGEGADGPEVAAGDEDGVQDDAGRGAGASRELRPRPDALARYGQHLHAMVAEAAAGRSPPRFTVGALGQVPVEVRGIDGERMTLYHLEMGSDMTLPLWSRLSAREKAELALASVRRDQPDDRATAVFWCRAAGKDADAATHLMQLDATLRAEVDAAFVADE